jgi:GT2 family glycosyltransferase
VRDAVVISTWTGNPPDYLLRLCDSIVEHPAGADYELALCANGKDYVPPTRVASLFKHVLVRENTGFNLGAWDHAWRSLPEYDRFLFLQDDCVVLEDGWLRSFIRCFETTPGCGLVGETLQRNSGRPWERLCDPKPIDRKDHDPQERVEFVSFVRQRLADWGIPEGDTALHVTTVVQFTSRKILEEVDGYNLGATKLEAIAAEIGFSRKLVAKGYRLAQVRRRRHCLIAHRQWPKNTFWARLQRSIAKRVSRKSAVAGS